MNLLPTEEKDILRRGLKDRFFVIFLIFISISFLIGFVMLLPSYFVSSKYFDANTNTQVNINEDGESIDSVLNIPSQMVVKINVFRSSINNISVVDTISKIIDLLPKGIIINSISFLTDQDFNGKKGVIIYVVGTASSRDSLVSYATLARNSNYFSAVDMPVSSLVKESNLPFAMKFFIEK